MRIWAQRVRDPPRVRFSRVGNVVEDKHEVRKRDVGEE